MRRFWARFWRALDSRSIAPFQYIFGVAFIAEGIYGILVADTRPPDTLQGSMSAGHVDLWYALLVTGPLCCLIGKSLKGDLTYAGRLMQVTGDVVVALSMLAFFTGSVETERWGSGTFAPIIGAALFCCALLFVIGDLRQLLDVEQHI